MNFRIVGRGFAAAIAAVAMGGAQAIEPQVIDRTFEDCVKTSAIDYVLGESKNYSHGFTREHEREWSVGDGWKYDSKDYWNADYDSYCAPIPEPQTYAMMALGLMLVAWTVRRRSSQAHA